MAAPVVVALPGSEQLGDRLAAHFSVERSPLVLRRFPDEETFVRLDAAVEGRALIIGATLDRPDAKLLPLVFLSDLARELGASRVVLAAPYLAYMRQDARFEPGEAVTSRSFARILDSAVDAIVTVDPHLHRYGRLADLYRVPTRVLHAAPLIADWIRQEIPSPVLIGPDAESEQWVSDVAGRAGAPHVVLSKIRHGDRDVEVSVPDVERWRDHRPVLVDDIISTARTMIETVGHLARAKLPAPVCIGVHAVFAGDAYAELLAAGAARVVTADTIVHESNAIGTSDMIARATELLLAEIEAGPAVE